jgi:hypothetical protein
LGSELPAFLLTDVSIKDKVWYSLAATRCLWGC